jgi:hypothetical protein
MTSLFKTIKKIRNSYEVKLLNIIKIYNIFSLNRLQKAAKDPLPGQVNKTPSLIIIITEEEYEIQEVLTSKLIQDKLLYRVK